MEIRKKSNKQTKKQTFWYLDDKLGGLFFSFTNEFLDWHTAAVRYF